MPGQKGGRFNSAIKAKYDGEALILNNVLGRSDRNDSLREGRLLPIDFLSRDRRTRRSAE